MSHDIVCSWGALVRCYVYATHFTMCYLLSVCWSASSEEPVPVCLPCLYNMHIHVCLLHQLSQCVWFPCPLPCSVMPNVNCGPSCSPLLTSHPPSPLTRCARSVTLAMTSWRWCSSRTRVLSSPPASSSLTSSTRTSWCSWSRGAHWRSPSTG